MKLTTQQAFDELSTRYPDEAIYAWDWITGKNGKGRRNYSVEVGDHKFNGDSLEEAVAAVKLPTPTEKAAEKRAQAVKLLEEAAKLDGKTDIGLIPLPEKAGAAQ